MIFKSSMRRGISLEVIVEEDDNAVVSLDRRLRIFESDDGDLSSPSSATSSCSGLEEKDDDSHWNGEGENHGRSNNNYDERHKEGKERRKRQKKETDERWRRLGKQRSLSCETLTILDVGDDHLSREQWEEEARDWDIEEENQIDQSISRRRILQYSMVSDDDEDEDLTDRRHDETDSSSSPEQLRGKGHMTLNSVVVERELERSVDDDDDDDDENYDSKIDFEEEDDEEIEKGDAASDRTDTSVSHSFAEDLPSTPEEGRFTPVAKTFLEPLWAQDPFGPDSDTWITVGELTEENDGQIKASTEDTKKIKEVTFSDEVQILDLSIPSSEDLEPQSSPEPQKSSPEPPKSSPEPPKSSPEPQKVSPNRVIEGDGKSPDVISDSLPTMQIVKNLFDKTMETKTKKSDILKKLEKERAPPKVVLVEKPSRKTCLHDQNKHVTTIQSGSLKRHSSANSILPSPVIHNKEIHLDELPPPHTVASVRQLFERLPVTIKNFHKTNSLGRFDHVRSNPSSKILRFDRDRRAAQRSPVNSLPVTSTPIAQTKSTPAGTGSLPNHVGNISSTEPLNGAESPRISVSRSATISLRPSQDLSSAGICLRKPKIVSRFNVMKALQENPRYFHMRMKDKSKESGDKAQHDGHAKGERISQEINSTHSSPHSPFRKRHSEILPAGRPPWLRDAIDRSDAESQSSESSEDSGVTKDFNSCILSKFSSSKNKLKYPSPPPQDGQFSADPSFKWIDPAVLAKIRSVGTTVIYFGPRHQRPSGNVTNCNSSSFRERSRRGMDRIEPQFPATVSGEFSFRNKGEPIERAVERRNDNNEEKRTPQAAPRIVGVLRKASCKEQEKEEKEVEKEAAPQELEQGINAILEASSPVTASKTPVTKGSRKAKVKPTDVNSVVYNFTRK